MRNGIQACADSPEAGLAEEPNKISPAAPKFAGRQVQSFVWPGSLSLAALALRGGRIHAGMRGRTIGPGLVGTAGADTLASFQVLHARRGPGRVPGVRAARQSASLLNVVLESGQCQRGTRAPAGVLRPWVP